MKTMLSMMLVLFVAVPLVAGEARKTAQPAATIGSVAVTVEDLDRAVGAKLTRVLTDQYNIRRGVLDELIATRLFEAEAARRKITVEELIAQEVTAKIAEPDPSEIEPVYEGVAERFPGMSKEQALAEIAASMRRTRTIARRTEFLKELRSAAGVRVYLQPPRVDVKAEGPSRGSADAPITIVAFSDYECPFCGRAVDTLKKVEQKYGEKVRIVFRDYPLPSHRTAKRAAEAAYCADEQGKFWDMHDQLFSKGGPIGEPDIQRFAAQIGADRQQFATCLASGKFKEAWKPGLEEGLRVGVQSTPTFFINGRLLVGAGSVEAFARIIDDELSGIQTKVAGK